MLTVELCRCKNLEKGGEQRGERDGSESGIWRPCTTDHFAAGNDRPVTALLEEKNQIILNQNRARFGQSSKKRTYLLSDDQMCLFDQAGDGITENAPEEASYTEEITVAAHTRKSKRMFGELAANLPEEDVIIPTSKQIIMGSRQ